MSYFTSLRSLAVATTIFSSTLCQAVPSVTAPDRDQIVDTRTPRAAVLFNKDIVGIISSHLTRCEQVDAKDAGDEVGGAAAAAAAAAPTDTSRQKTDNPYELLASQEGERVALAFVHDYYFLRGNDIVTTVSAAVGGDTSEIPPVGMLRSAPGVTDSYLEESYQAWRKDSMGKSFYYFFLENVLLPEYKSAEKALPGFIKDICGSIELRALSQRVLPHSVSQFRNLARIQIKESRLTELPDVFAFFVRLQELFVSGKVPLKTLPKSLCSLSSLESLEVPVTFLPSYIAKATNLHTLMIHTFDCAEKLQLSELPSSVGQLKKLTTLGLIGTSITVLPDELGDLKSLRYLTLPRNSKLKALPDSLTSLESLVSIYLLETPTEDFSPALLQWIDGIQIVEGVKRRVPVVPRGHSVEEFDVESRGSGRILIAKRNKLSRLWFYKDPQDPNPGLKGFELQPWSVEPGDHITFTHSSLDCPRTFGAPHSLEGFGVAFVSDTGQPFSERQIRSYGEGTIELTVPPGVFGLTPLVYANYEEKDEDSHVRLDTAKVYIEKGRRD